MKTIRITVDVTAEEDVIEDVIQDMITRIAESPQLGASLLDILDIPGVEKVEVTTRELNDLRHVVNIGIWP